MAAVEPMMAEPPGPRPTAPLVPISAPVTSIVLGSPHSSFTSMDVDQTSQSPDLIIQKDLGGAPATGETRIPAIVFGQGQEQIISVFAEVLGKPSRVKGGFQQITLEDDGYVIGISVADAKNDIGTRDKGLVVAINTHFVKLGMPPDTHLSAHCDYEFLYIESPYFRRDLARFTSFILGQTRHHETLMVKPRTYFLSTTFPDIRAALPNLDILTVGADAIELRVDLLRDTVAGEELSEVPDLSYVGEQVMLLRQRTELPIIFTCRCTRENGQFPIDNPELCYEYLKRAIQWGVEYIDVELWLPEQIRRTLYEKRGSSRIMSAFHEFSGNFKWLSKQAEEIFDASRKYADIVKMNSVISEHNENFELEYFRSKMRSEHPDAPPLSAVNMGEVGQFSRTLNTVFTPITHPLLPMVGAPGQLSAAAINAALSSMRQLPKKDIYGISTSIEGAAPQGPFYEKCFNELGLPHRFTAVERQLGSPASLDGWCNQKHFGGAYLTPGIHHRNLTKKSPFFSGLNGGAGPTLTEAAQAIGIVDTIIVRSNSSSSSSCSTPGSIASSPSTRQIDPIDSNGCRSGLPQNASLIFDNAGWKGILSTLTRVLTPSAYFGRTAVVMASSSDDAAPVFFALRALKISKIYTVGFRTPSAVARNAPPIEQFVSLESLQRARSDNEENAPFVIVSALGADKSNLVGMLVRAFGATTSQRSVNAKKVFLDLADGTTGRTSDPALVAEKSGFSAYGAVDVKAFTTVETLRVLVGQNVSCSFVRLAKGVNVY